ncbi:MAG: outer membrane protein assembly factor BamD [Calditrichaeota bacterium]|nr:MAG: outer membrane protein assembly factor BamD [Calditrichota bacterium]
MLTPRKRIRKKDLKEDKLVTLYFQAREWTEEHINYILGGAAGLLVILLGLFLLSYLHGKAENTAGIEFSKASKLYQASDYRNAVTQFNNIVDRYSRTSSGKLARYYLAQSLYKTNDYTAAQRQFSKFSSVFSADDHLKTSALAGVAACLEEQGKYEEAAKKYQAIVKKYDDAPLASYFLIRAARCCELSNDKAKAKELYKQLITKYPESREKDDAVLLSAQI